MWIQIKHTRTIEAAELKHLWLEVKSITKSTVLDMNFFERLSPTHTHTHFTRISHNRLCVFTCGRSQQPQSPDTVLQQVVPSGQLVTGSHGTFPTCASCLGIVGRFLTKGAACVPFSQVMTARLHFWPLWQQCMKSSQQTALGQQSQKDKQLTSRAF